ncbi:MAG: D-alanyl-D-alanine carboxypeptidase/D-alanyl-D-alanine-endopeptidase [Myxococcales bacterium]|nr:D-alanyl-D-alanine carboxypeptidase/D-alanyl-D-alanine-endopeptidase [Myxococcales bacterium]
MAPAPTLRSSSIVQPADVGRASAIQELKEGLEAIWTGASLRLGTTAVYVVDAETGEPLYDVHGADALNPASNVKLISTATVLATLGPDWRYRTRLLGAAADAEGVVEGGLYLHGTYDPTLGPLALEELARNLHAQGVTRIAGDIVLDESPLRDTLALSQVRITVRGTAPGKPASIETWPATNFVAVASNRAHSKKSGRSRVRVSSRLVENEGEPARLALAIRGTIRKGHTRILHVPIRRRSTFTGSAMHRALQDAGIAVDGVVRIAKFSDFNEEAGRAGRIPFPLATHESHDIASLVKRVNKRSLNHLSDRLVMTAAQSVFGGPLQMSSAVTLMKNWLTGIGVDADSVVLDTGSGLSYRTQLSARQIVTVLRAAGGFIPDAMPQDAAQSYRASLALGGVDGTLRRRFRLPGARVKALVTGKTGTLTRVIALSGFIARQDGRALCFSIVTNGHHNHRKRTVRLEHEHMVAELDGYLGHTVATPQAAAMPVATPTRHSDQPSLPLAPGAFPR